jgi:hypothetical protein
VLHLTRIDRETSPVEVPLRPPRGGTSATPFGAAELTTRGGGADVAGRHQRRPNKPLNKSKNTGRAEAARSAQPRGNEAEGMHNGSEEPVSRSHDDEQHFAATGDGLKNMRKLFDEAARRAAQSDEGGAGAIPANDFAVRMRRKDACTEENQKLVRHWLARSATPSQCCDALAERISRRGRSNAAPRNMQPELDSAHCDGCSRPIRPGDGCPLRVPDSETCIGTGASSGRPTDTGLTA